MPKYLIHVSYNAEGVKGLVKDGALKRQRVAGELIKSVGGTVEAFYYAFGEDDAYVLIDAPDHASVAAASLAVNSSGVVTTKTTVLMTAEEMEEATKKSSSYSPPGK